MIHDYYEMLKDKDPGLQEHSDKVATLAMTLASTMGLPEHKIRQIGIAAKYHDIGKLFIPDTILNKPDKLTQEEFEIIKTHPDKGADMAKGLFSSEVCKMIRFHHEDESGCGYHHLSGDEIPLGAKIIHVCDVYEALTADRRYKKGYPVRKALEIIENGIGKNFNPHIACCFIDMQLKAIVNEVPSFEKNLENYQNILPMEKVELSARDISDGVSPNLDRMLTGVLQQKLESVKANVSKEER